MQHLIDLSLIAGTAHSKPDTASTMPPVVPMKSHGTSFSYENHQFLSIWAYFGLKRVYSDAGSVPAPCTWRIVSVDTVRSRRCVMDHVIKPVIKRNSSCFDACPQPTDRTSDCWITCVSTYKSRFFP